MIYKKGEEKKKKGESYGLYYNCNKDNNNDSWFPWSIGLDNNREQGLYISIVLFYENNSNPNLRIIFEKES